MSTLVGTTLKIDEQGAPYEAVCEFRCTHRVVPVTRRSITIVEEKLVRDLFMEGWSNKGPQPPCVTAYRALEADGTEWTKNWEGSHGDGYSPTAWETADGRTAYPASPSEPAIRGRETGYAFTDLTNLTEPGGRHRA